MQDRSFSGLAYTQVRHLHACGVPIIMVLISRTATQHRTHPLAYPCMRLRNCKHTFVWLHQTPGTRHHQIGACAWWHFRTLAWAVPAQAFLDSDAQELVLGPSAFQGPTLGLHPSLNAQQEATRAASSSAESGSALLQQLAQHTAPRRAPPGRACVHACVHACMPGHLRARIIHFAGPRPSMTHQEKPVC